MISQNQPLVTIGIPTFNRLSGLKNALKCIREQTYANLEIIVSDNCSTDDGVDQYMQILTKSDSRIRYFRQSHNIGALANFEFLVGKASGKYFAWAADDDLCNVRFVEEIIHLMELNSDIALCSCDVQSIDEHDNIIGIDRLESIRPIYDWNQTRKLFFRYPTSNIFFSIYGIYNTHSLNRCDLKIMCGWKGYATNGEVPFLAKLSSFGKIVAIPKLLKSYRRHSDSVYHNELRSIKNLDVFMLRLVIRSKLCKMAIFDKSDISNRITLLNAVFTSLFSSINLRSIIVSLLPRTFVKFAKKLRDWH